MKPLWMLLCSFCLLRSAAQDRVATVRVAANPSLSAGGFKTFLLGENYRREWTTPVAAPVLWLDHRGLRVEKEGGGKQTHSLHLSDSQGRRWSLRSVRKYNDRVLPPLLQGTIARGLLENEISASYPYGALSVGPLAQATGVPYLKNTLVYLPDQPAVDSLKKHYAGQLYLLEAPPDAQKTIPTNALVQKVQQDERHRVDQQAVLRARLLDNFIMDFDRHEQQWEWIERDSGGAKWYRPLPKDRDQAFFHTEGLLPTLLGKMQAFHQLQGLHAKTHHIATFNFAARNFDRAFLNALDRQDWQQAVDRFLAAVTDSVLGEALRGQPPEVRGFSAAKMLATLEKKRRYFRHDMLEYYQSLAKRVSVTGTRGRELFVVEGKEGGLLDVGVWSLDSAGTRGAELYHRIFDPQDTKELRLYGLEGDDRFLIAGGPSKVKLRLIGGPGRDTVINEGAGKKIFCYDLSLEDNRLRGPGLKNRLSQNPMINEYQRLGFGYNRAAPGVKVEYARDGGFYLGPAFTMRKQGFRKDSFAFHQQVALTHALNAASWHLHYESQFTQLIAREDVLLKMEVSLPTSRTRFYGLGNETRNARPFERGSYYLARYQLGGLTALLQHHFSPLWTLQYGPMAQYFQLAGNGGHYIEELFPERQQHEARWYAGGLARVVLDSRNSPVFPSRGMLAESTLRYLAQLGGGSAPLKGWDGQAAFFVSPLRGLVVASCFGGGYNWGDFNLAQAQYLGFLQNLRGYRMQRFAGRARAFNNTEVRLKLATLNLYVIKGPFGLTGFHDVGRVWWEGEASRRWHRGYGGGVWIIPFDRVVLSGLLTYSREERHLPIFHIGYYF